MSGVKDWIEWKCPATYNSVKYVVRTYDVRKKMSTEGRYVQSLPFFVGGESGFTIFIYPNGDERKTRGHISVFVQNESDWFVRIQVHCKMGKTSVKDVFQLDAHHFAGWPKFCEHSKVVVAEDDTVDVSVDITLIFEEASGENNIKAMVRESQSDIESLRDEVSVLTKMMNTNLKIHEKNLKEKIVSLQSSFVSELEALRTASNRNGAGAIPCPECPVCFEEMKPPTRIAQCLAGHLICLQCKERPEVSSCPSCKQRFTGGRAIGMENYLSTLFA